MRHPGTQTFSGFFSVSPLSLVCVVEHPLRMSVFWTLKVVPKYDSFFLPALCCAESGIGATSNATSAIRRVRFMVVLPSRPALGAWVQPAQCNYWHPVPSEACSRRCLSAG